VVHRGLSAGRNVRDKNATATAAGKAVMCDGMQRCQVEACPEANSEAWHRCFVCQRQPIEHHHVLRRSTHPDKKLDPYNLVALCPRHHQLVTEHKWSDLIYAHPNGEMHYNVKDENGLDKCDRAIGVWSAEARAYHRFDDLPPGDEGEPGIPETPQDTQETAPAVVIEFRRIIFAF